MEGVVCTSLKVLPFTPASKHKDLPTVWQNEEQSALHPSSGLWVSVLHSNRKQNCEWCWYVKCNFIESFDQWVLCSILKNFFSSPSRWLLYLLVCAGSEFCISGTTWTLCVQVMRRINTQLLKAFLNGPLLTTRSVGNIGYATFFFFLPRLPIFSSEVHKTPT